MSITFNTIGITLNDGTTVQIASADGKDISTSRSQMTINGSHSIDLPLGLVTIREEQRLRAQVLIQSAGRAPGAFEEIRQAAMRDYNAIPREERVPGMKSQVTSAIDELRSMGDDPIVSNLLQVARDLGPSLFPSMPDNASSKIYSIIAKRAEMTADDHLAIRSAKESVSFIDAMTKRSPQVSAGLVVRDDVTDIDFAQPETAQQELPVRRGRGRPRKNPLQVDLFSSPNVPVIKNPEIKDDVQVNAEGDLTPINRMEIYKYLQEKQSEVYAPEPVKSSEPATVIKEEVAEKKAEIVEKKRWPPRRPLANIPVEAVAAPVAVRDVTPGQPVVLADPNAVASKKAANVEVDNAETVSEPVILTKPEEGSPTNVVVTDNGPSSRGLINEGDAAQRAIDAFDRMLDGDVVKRDRSVFGADRGGNQDRVRGPASPRNNTPQNDDIGEFMNAVMNADPDAPLDDELYNDPFFEDLDVDPVFEDEDNRGPFGA